MNRSTSSAVGSESLLDVTGRNGVNVPKILLGKKAIPNLKERLEEALRRRPHQESVALRVQRASAVVRMKQDCSDGKTSTFRIVA